MEKNSQEIKKVTTLDYCDFGDLIEFTQRNKRTYVGYYIGEGKILNKDFFEDETKMIGSISTLETGGDFSFEIVSRDSEYLTKLQEFLKNKKD